MKVGYLVNSFLSNFNIQIKRNSAETDFKRRQKMIKHYNIEKVIDIGANIGDYAINLRRAGFKGKIISFEPLSVAFQAIQNLAKHDSNWEVFNTAMGNCDEEKFINIAGNSESSSLLDMLPEHALAAPASTYTGREKNYRPKD